MESTGQSVTLTAEQIAELNKKLATFRHDINNNLALIMAGLEVMQSKPHLAERMMATVAEQPPKIAEAVGKFSAEFERALGLKR
jgi:aspartokinase